MIEHIKGNLLEVKNTILGHQVNCMGVMGGGVALQVKEKYPTVFLEYASFCEIYKDDTSQLLGKTQFIETEDGHIIANMFSQDDYGRNGCFTDYESVEACMKAVAKRAEKIKASVAFPYLYGCYRGGGDWTVVYGIIEKYFKDSEVLCTIVEYDGGRR